MSFLEDERKNAIRFREKLFQDPGGGYFQGKDRDFVLKDATHNLWPEIRHDAMDYFKRNNISWWMGIENNEPSGHLLSSQVACLNHLYFIRQKKDIATSILKNIDPNIVEAVLVNDGYVEFEVIGAENYLGEKSHSRGANSTSIDALMVGRKSDGSNVLILIEWKYTETYGGERLYIPQRYAIYNKLLDEPGCPIVTDNYESMYFEPFYQLMRQTLLSWKMVQNSEYACDEFFHVHVIPEDNIQLRRTVTSPTLVGKSMSEAWKNVLAEKDRYRVVTPTELLKSISELPNTKSILTYLNERYST